jgi:hypothetical protein
MMLRSMGLVAILLALPGCSNVRSLALSMNQKQTLAAACEDSLRALNEALSKREFPGTR